LRQRADAKTRKLREYAAIPSRTGGSEGCEVCGGFWESLRRFEIGTVDGSEIPRPTTVWMYKHPVNDRISTTNLNW